MPAHPYPVRCMPSRPILPSSRVSSRTAGQLAALVPVGDVRQDLVGAEVPHGLPDGQLLLGEQRVDAGRVMRVKAVGPAAGRAAERRRAHYPSVSAPAACRPCPVAWSPPGGGRWWRSPPVRRPRSSGLRAGRLGEVALAGQAQQHGVAEDQLVPGAQVGLRRRPGPAWPASKPRPVHRCTIVPLVEFRSITDSRQFADPAFVQPHHQVLPAHRVDGDRPLSAYIARSMPLTATPRPTITGQSTSSGNRRISCLRRQFGDDDLVQRGARPEVDQLPAARRADRGALGRHPGPGEQLALPLRGLPAGGVRAPPAGLQDLAVRLVPARRAWPSSAAP